MPDINIASGGGEGRKYVIFTGLLPLCPKSSGRGCRLVACHGSIFKAFYHLTILKPECWYSLLTVVLCVYIFPIYLLLSF